MYNNQDVVNFLNNLAIHGSDSEHGVCMLLEDTFNVQFNIRESVYESWEHFSGDDSYPIPSTVLGMTEQQAFHNSPKWEGEYGKLRRDWCRHLAEYVAQYT